MKDLDVKTSVIIPVYNDKTNLFHCLESIFDTSYEEFEVIVIDDNSDENIEDVIGGFPCKYIKLQNNVGQSAARNIGVRKSSGDIVLFTDSDCVVMKDWVKRFTEEMVELRKSDQNISAVIGKLDSSKTFVEMAHVYSLYAYVLGGKQRYMDFINTSCAGVWKDSFLDVGGFSEDMRVGEDQELALKLVENDKKILFTPDIHIFHNHGIMSCKGTLLKNYQYGKTMGLDLYEKHPEKFAYWLKILSKPILHLFLIFPIALATTVKIIKYNIKCDWFVILYSPLIFLNKMIFRIGIFTNFLDKRGSRT